MRARCSECGTRERGHESFSLPWCIYATGRGFIFEIFIPTREQTSFNIKGRKALFNRIMCIEAIFTQVFLMKFLLLRIIMELKISSEYHFSSWKILIKNRYAIFTDNSIIHS